MAYMDDQALEREQTRQKLLEGKTPLLGADTSAALRAIMSSPDALSQLQQLLGTPSGRAPKGVAQTPTDPLRVAPGDGRRPGGGEEARWDSGSPDLGGALKGILDAAKVGRGSKLPKSDEKPGSGRGASVRDAAVRGRHGSEPAPTPPPPVPGPYGQPMPAPGTTVTGPKDHAGGTGGGVAGNVPGLPGGPSGRSLTREERAAASAAATGGRMLPGASLDGVDPRIAEIVGAAAEGLPPGYKIKPTSGHRTEGQGQHTKGKAVDWQIIDPDGKPISNRGDDSTGMYTKLAQNAYGYQEKHHPDMTGTFQWGGQFGTSKLNPNEPDLMHFDNGGRRGRITKYSRESIGATLPPGGDQRRSAAAPAAATSTTAAPAAAATPAGARAAGVPPELSKLVMSKEWFVPTPKDDYGQKSIGYGTSANGRTSITEPEARAEMNAQLQRHLNKIDTEFPNLSPDVRNSVASLTYNVGEGWMSEKGNQLSAALKAGDMQAAKQVFLQYKHVTENGVKKELRGLRDRRIDEARAFDGQKPQYTPNPDAPKGAQPAAAAAAPAAAAPQQMAPDFKRSATAAPKPPDAAIPPAAAAVAPPPPQPAAAPPPPATPAPAPAAPRPPPAPAAAAASPPAAPRPAPPVNPAHAFLDGKVGDVVEKIQPGGSSQIPEGMRGMTVREMLNHPMYGGMAKSQMGPALGKLGVTQQQVDQALKEGPPKLEKRSDAGTSEGLLDRAQGLPPDVRDAVKTQYAQADTGIATDAGVIDRRGDAPVDPNNLLSAKSVPEVAGDMAMTLYDTYVKPDVPETPLGRDLGVRELSRALKGEAPIPQATPRPPSGNERATIDPASQPAVQNADGTISTVNTIGIEENGREVNIPTVPAEGGRVMSNDEAIQRYKETGRHLGKYETQEQAAVAADRLHNDEASAISQHPQGQQPTISPELAQALENAFKDEARVPQAPPPPPEAMPVLPVEVAPPLPPGGPAGAPPPGGLSLAPQGLQTGINALMPGASQGGSIAMAGMLPPIQNSTFSTPLLDSMAASPGGSSAFNAGSFMPISLDMMGGLGWGGGMGSGFGSGGGFDFGSDFGGGGFDLGGGLGGGMTMPMMSGFGGG